MAKPSLTKKEVTILVPTLTYVGDPFPGGAFKQVFPCAIDTEKIVVKFLLANPHGQDGGAVSREEMEALIYENRARVMREVETLGLCRSPHLVKLGSIGLTTCKHEGMELIFYSEELIVGDLVSNLVAHPLHKKDVVRLGRNICHAIDDIWRIGRIHRDVKPDNIMRRESNGDFVLLDLGIAFDILGTSLTSTGVALGTPGYFSPEQLDLSNKRQLDFRSDLFSLGIVLYEAATGQRPFPSRSSSIDDAFHGIVNSRPATPSELRPEIPERLSDVIMRLLRIQPHQRYRSCEQLDHALSATLA